MEFRDEDSKWERDLKLRVIEIYNSKLDARAERKKFILERGLLERKEKKRSKDEREVVNSMRVFSRFHSPEEHEAFIHGLISQLALLRAVRYVIFPFACLSSMLFLLLCAVSLQMRSVFALASSSCKTGV
jgi:hypothetical protein